MAKKKLSHPSQTHDLKSVTPIDDPNVQIHNLKNLNSVLLKETTERRQQIESLLNDKELLQSALHRNAMAAEASFSDANLAFDLQNDVLSAFVENQMKEIAILLGERECEVAALKREVNELTTCLENERVRLSEMSREKDRMKSEFAAQAKLLEETQNNEKMLREEAEKLRLEGEKLLEEGSEKEREIAELKKDRDLAVKSSQENAKVVDELKEEIHGVTREKNEIQKVNDAQELKITGLESELKQLTESLNSSHNEEALMRSKILQLEESLGLVTENEKQKEMEISALLREKKDMEKSLDNLNKVLDEIQKELENKQHELDETTRVRDELLQVKISRGNEIVELQGEVSQLRDRVENLKALSRESEEKNKQLLSQVNQYKNTVDEVVLEKDEIRKGFDEEKMKVKNLELKLAGVERKFEQSLAELDQMRSEQEKLLEKITMLKKEVDALMKEKNALQSSLQKAQRESNDLRAKVEFSGINSEKALTMLKSTAEFLCQYKESAEEVVSNGRKLEEEIEPYARELDAIRNAFKSKNEIVDDMKQQVVTLQKSVAEAHRSKSLWTVISSATTIFAAVLAAYVARGR